MSAGCKSTINVGNDKALALIKKEFGTDETFLRDILMKGFKSMDANGIYMPNQNFLNWYKDNYNSEFVASEHNAKDTAKIYKEFGMSFGGSVSDTTHDEHKNSVNKNYTSDNAQKNGYKISAGSILSVYNQLNGRGTAKEHIGDRDFFNRGCIYVTRAELGKRIAKAKGFETEDEGIKYINTEYPKSNKSVIDFYTEALGGEEHMTPQDKNLVAMMDEMINNKEDFFNHVWGTDKLNSLKVKEESTDDDITDNSDDYVTIQSRSDVDGKAAYQMMAKEDSKSTSKSMDIDLTMYLNTLPKLSSTEQINGEYPTQVDSDFGLSEYMDADEVLKVLTAKLNNSLNIDDMREKIAAFARMNQDYAGLIKLYDDMGTDAGKDLAAKVWNQFGNNIITKSQIIQSGDKTESQITNKRSDSKTVLIDNFYRAIRHTTLDASNVDMDYRRKNLAYRMSAEANREGLNALFTMSRDDINKSNYHTATAADILEDYSDLIRTYYPMIKDSIIDAYLRDVQTLPGGKKETPYDRFLKLEKVMELTIGAAQDTQKNKFDIELQIQQKEDTNSNLQKGYALLKRSKELNKKGKTLSHHERDMMTKYGVSLDAEFTDYRKDERYTSKDEFAELRSKDFTSTGQTQALVTLANYLDKYIASNVSLDSYNADRSRSSDRNDSDRIMQIKRAIENPEILKLYGDQWKKDVSLRYNNFIVKGDGHEGLFEIDKAGNWHPTKNASILLSTRRFDGVVNEDTHDSATYSRMQESDYVTAAYTSFFNPALDRAQADSGLRYGQYFMRTPSDAPKNYNPVLPKYAFHSAAGDLFKIKDEDIKAIRNDIDGFIEKKVDASKGNFRLGKDKYSLIEGEFTGLARDLINKNKTEYTLTGKGIDGIVDDYLNRNSTERQRFPIFLKGTGDAIVIEGVFDGKRTLKDISYVGALDKYSKDTANLLNKYLNKTVTEDRKVNRILNRNHPIFKQYRNAMKQELLAAEVALHNFFDFDDNGNVVLNIEGPRAGKAKFNSKFNLSDDGIPRDTLNIKGIDNYHYKVNEKNEAEWFDKNGELTGNVFHSNRFTLDVGGVEKNYGEEAIKDAFNSLLYGGLKVTMINDKVDDIALTKEQQDIIDQHLDDYITELCNQAESRLNDYGHFIKNVSTDREHVDEFITNTNLTYYAFDDLYEGNSKFYGSAQDFLKRAKEAQAGGKSYGMTNYNKPLDSKAIVTALSVDKFTKVTKDEEGNYITEDYKVPAKDKFKAVTVYNSIVTDKNNIKRLARLWNRNMGISFTEDTLESTLGYKILKRNHEGTKANDAQSYITFDEWVRRIAGRGQLKEYKPLIDAILDESKPVDAVGLNKFVQEQKNFYFDIVFDSNNGVLVPRQIKNSEFVLVPRFIKGTELEAVYDVMHRNGISQLNTRETSKAGKSGVFRLWDDEGKLVGLNDFEKNCNAFAQEYDYSNLYTQQETVQHTNTDNKLAIQICKKIVDNVPDHTTVHNLKQRFFDTYKHKIERSFYDLCDELEIPREGNHIKLTEQGDIAGVNYEKLFKRLKEEALRGGVDENMIDYFTPRDGETVKAMQVNGFSTINTVMPMYNPNMSAKAQSVINAVFNSSITKQKVNGFHCAQITNVGFGYNKNDIIRDNKLRYHSRYDKELKENVDTNDIEIAMTYSSFGIDVNSPHYVALRKQALEEAKAESEARNKELSDTSIGSTKWIEKYGAATGRKNKPKRTPWNDKEIEIRAKDIFDQKIIDELREEGLDRVIAYRIPTEGKQSMAIARIAHFLDDVYGSTIAVPNEWVAQTGSDFDIDSVYGIQNRSYKDHDGRVRKVKYQTMTTRDGYNNYAAQKIRDAESLKGGTSKIFGAKGIYTNKDINTIASTYYKKQRQTNLSLQLTKDESKFLANAAKYAKIKGYSADQLYDMSVQGIDKFVKDGKRNELLKEVAQLRRDLNKDIHNLDFTGLSNEEKLAFNAEEVPVMKFKELLKEERNKEVESLKDEYGFKSFEDWCKGFVGHEDSSDYNSDDALDNRLVETMIDILGNPSQTEENLSSSTFANITGKVDSEDVKKVQAAIARGDYDFDKLNLNIPFKDWPALQQVTVAGKAAENAKLRNNRSPYNFFDQADYMNDVMSGARLKAFSVTRDTFCSVCNTVRPYLGKGYEIKVKYADGKVVSHDKLGWSENNRNIDGYLITAYSSQTSAHAFDAVKEGAIPNVNDYTFAVYKLFPEIGSNYTTAVSYIMQPGIARIVKAYQRTNSVFNLDDNNSNPIHDAISDIADDLGVHSSGSIFTLMNILKSTMIRVQDTKDAKGNTKANYRTFLDIFKEVFPDAKNLSLKPEDIADVPFDVKRQLRRNWSTADIKTLNEEDKAKMLAYDLGTILQFNRLNKIANKVTNIARVANPDKFGAKQTIWENKKTFTDIAKICNEFDLDSNESMKDGILMVPAEKGDSYDETYVRKYQVKEYDIPEHLKEKGVTQDTVDIRTDIPYDASGNPIKENGKYIRLKYNLKDTSETIDRIPILEAIYPGISNGIDAYMKGNTDGVGRGKFSRYPTLDAFLRYATATSIKAAKPFFKTESDYFNHIIDGITEVFDKTSYVNQMDEQTHNDVRDYIIGSYYDDVPILTSKVNSETKNHVHQRFVIDKKGNKDDEVRRIYGYTSRADLKVNRDGEYKPYTVKNFNKPTKKEIAEFETFSPAQKVEWLKQNMRDPEIFGLLDTTLFYTGNSKRLQGRQFINYTEDSYDIDAVRESFERAIDNENPLIASAALDLIKYSFVVEGNRPTSRGITDVIKNSTLLRDLTKPSEISTRDGSIIDLVDSRFNVDGYISTQPTEYIQDYVRSHTSSKYLPHTYIHSKKISNIDDEGNHHEQIVNDLVPDENNMIIIPKEKYGVLKRNKIGIGDKEEGLEALNKYVVLRNRKFDTLYKIRKIDGDDNIILYPLNRLEANEHHTDFSVNENNNIYPSEDFFEKKIDEFEKGLKNKVISADNPSMIANADSDIKPENFKYTLKTDKSKGEGSDKKLDLYTPHDTPDRHESNSFRIIRDNINEFYSDPRNYTKDFYFHAGIILQPYISKFGIDKGQTQLMQVKQGDKVVDTYYVQIYKVPLRSIAKKYLSTSKVELPKSIKDRYGDIIEKTRNSKIATNGNVSDRGFDDVYVATRLGGHRSTTTEGVEVNSEKADISSTGELDDTPRKENVDVDVKQVRLQKERQVAYGLYSYMKDIHEKDANAEKQVKALDKLGISSYNGGIDANTDTVIHAGAQYIRDTASDIIDEVEHFITLENPDGSHQYVSITNPEVMKQIKNDDDLRLRFLNLIEKARAIENRFKEISTIQLHSEDKIVNDDIASIRQALTDLSSNEYIQNAYMNYGNDFLQSQSDNILIQQKLLNVLDGYYSTSMVNSWFGDLQDVSNPLIQIVTKRSMQRIRAREFEDNNYMHNFDKQWDAIFAKAAAAGLPLSTDDIITADGKLKQRYTKDFFDDYFKLNDALTEAKIIHGEYSIEAAKAKLAKDEWLADNVQQAIRDITPKEYYEQEYDKWQNDFIKLTERKYINDAISKNAFADRKKLKEEYKALKKEHNISKDEWVKKQLDRDPLAGGKKTDYYHRRNALVREILDNAPDIYIEYKKHQNELYRLQGLRTDLVNDELENKIDAERKAIAKLKQTYDYDEDGFPVTKKRYKKDDSRLSSNPEIRRKQLINSLNSAEALNKFIDENSNISQRYFTRDVKDTFESDLKKNLDILHTYEQKDKYGHIKVSRSKLIQEHEDYAKAVEWLNRNTRQDFDTNEDTSISILNYLYKNQDLLPSSWTDESNHDSPWNATLESAKANGLFDETKGFSRPDNTIPDSTGSSILRELLTQAYETLRGSKNTRAFYRAIINAHKGSVDKFGVTDARQFSEEEIARIKEKQDFDYGNRQSNTGADTKLMTSAGRPSGVYTSEFYKGLSAGGVDNVAHLRLVRNFNGFIAPFWDPENNRINTSRMTEDELYKLDKFLTLLSRSSSKTGASDEDKEAAKKFREENAQYAYSDDAKAGFNEERVAAQAKGTRYFAVWQAINEESVEDQAENVPRRMLYAHIEPKDEVKDKFTDRDKEWAIHFLDKMYETTYTDYFYDKWKEMQSKDDAYKHEHPEEAAAGKVHIFDDWWNKNSVFNPYTHQREPLMCWTTSRMTNENFLSYVPKGEQLEGTIKEEYKNKDWHEGNQGTMLGLNYKVNPNADNYNAHLNLNDSQKELYELITKMMDDYVKDPRAKNYTRNGQLPAKANPNYNIKGDFIKQIGKNAADLFGIGPSKDVEDDQSNVSYDSNQYAMPMLELFKGKQLEKVKLQYPNETDYENTSEGKKEYWAALDAYHKKKREQDADDLKTHASMISHDWKNVFKQFIIQAGRYNAVADERLDLLYGRQMLDRPYIYDKNPITGKYKYDKTMSAPGNPQYLKVRDNNLIAEYDNWLKRLILDIWKEPTERKLNRFAGSIQNLTSNMYMMLNIRGGISNITTGLTNIVAEIFAREHFDRKSWQFSQQQYFAHINDYIKHMFDDKSDSLAGGIIKFMNIVDFDELNGQVKLKDEENTATKARTLAFGTNSMGEHYMQNSAMLAMMDSHRLILTPEFEKNGRPKYSLMTQAEYAMRKEGSEMMKYLDEKYQDEWIDFLNDITSNPEHARKYAWYRNDAVMDFALRHLSEKDARELGKKRKEIYKEAEKEFNSDNNQRLYDQFELGDDGYVHIKKGSLLDSMNTKREGHSINDAYLLLGGFKQRVIATNKKIHGFYDRMAQAQIEKTLVGSLIMQYHKHILPGFLKAYRRQGYFNEERGTIEKGRYTAIWDFIRLPIDTIKAKSGMSDEQANTVKGIQNLFKNLSNAISIYRTAWYLLPPREKSNMARNFGFGLSIMGGLFGALGVNLIMNNTNKDSTILNLALYEFDRLASESGQFNPIQFQTQANTLWSQPVAAMSIVNDLENVMGEFAAMLIQGEDYDGTYHSGMYAGQNKLGVFIGRRIPIYRQYQALEGLSKNNSAYHIGDNMLTFFGANPKAIANYIKGEDE